ncbi:MAG: UDP-N-acetylmuramoyl-L-alanyl-D-glutamate--2,6-diaminopimelate ligase, partial [Rhodobacteraceae bacterium]|nr:UDP-N-acetylmuramoyl-L-alanyl-D-glutamate--2,6-diaminopimelate ligase [Paracoccaceae bacterium]
MGGTEHQSNLAGLGLTARGGAEAWIAGIALDTRAVRPGWLFAALPGSRVHGAAFVAAALEAGAAAVLTDAAGAALAAPALAGRGVPLVVAEDARAALAGAAALWFGAQPEVVAAVTGTNGKT